ncbi:hypothetical protein P5G60_09365 [Paenibacillus jamilae]|nr:hypothetical protein [Paenibacillus jamilae]
MNISGMRDYKPVPFEIACSVPVLVQRCKLQIAADRGGNIKNISFRK